MVLCVFTCDPSSNTVVEFIGCTRKRPTGSIYRTTWAARLAGRGDYLSHYRVMAYYLRWSGAETFLKLRIARIYPIIVIRSEV